MDENNQQILLQKLEIR